MLTRADAAVVIPAHNESAVIGRTLECLLRDARPGEFEVVVVANSCTDDTAEVARAAGVRVLTTPKPGKVGALLLGDAAVTAFPRLYLDADVELSTSAVRAMAAVLAGPALACAPTPRFDLTGASRLVTRYHRVHERMMAERRGLAGAGAYMLSERGHARVFPLPDVISDDGYVHRSFAAGEAPVLEHARSVVRPPRKLGATLRRRARVRRGNSELDALGHHGIDAPMALGALADRVRGGEVGLTDSACYLSVLVVDRGLHKWRNGLGLETGWATDDTARATLSAQRLPQIESASRDR